MIQSHYDEIDRIGQEKERLAQRVVQLVVRARARLDADLGRVLVLQGEPDLSVQTGYYPTVLPKNPITQVNETLRSVASVTELPSTPTSSGAPPTKSTYLCISNRRAVADYIVFPTLMACLPLHDRLTPDWLDCSYFVFRVYVAKSVI